MDNKLNFSSAYHP
jgi:hypothetical protein